MSYNKNKFELLKKELQCNYLDYVNYYRVHHKLGLSKDVVRKYVHRLKLERSVKVVI